MKIFIYVQTRFEAIHCWPSCPFEEVSFLRNPHRHEFWVKAKIPVTHTDRDVEFIMAKRKLDALVSELFHGRDLGATSCEMMCQLIIEATILPITSISVFEDGENGAEIVLE